MQDKLFDNFIKGKIQHATANVPDGLWEKIIAQDKKRRVGFWWLNSNLLWVALGILLVGSIGYVSIRNTTGKKEIAVNTSTNQNPSSSNLGEIDRRNKEVVIENPSTIIPKKEKIGEELKTESSTSTQKQKIEGFELSVVSNQLSNNIIKVDELGNTKLFTLNKKQTSTPKNKTNNLLNVPLDKAAKFELDVVDNYALPFLKFEAGNTVSLSKNLMSSNSKLALIPPIINMRKLLGLNGDECGDYKPKDFYIETYGSADFSKKRVTNISTSESYLRRKDSAEQQQLGFNAGVRLMRNLADNWYIKAGVQFSQINELFTNKIENERRLTTVITTRTLIRPGLADTTISDTTSLLQIGYKTERTRNRYSSIEIPILLSYETGSDESNWRFALTGGLIINATTWYSGKTYDDNFNVVNLKPTNTGFSFYRHQLGFSAYASASIVKKLTPSFSLFLEPYYRVGINKNNISAGFTQQFNNMGATLGLRYRLNKKY